ncbi:MAG: hypothetical protein ACLPYM_02980 [Limisphaerales bacterium]
MKTIGLPGKQSFLNWLLVIDHRLFAAGAGYRSLGIGYSPKALALGYLRARSGVGYRSSAIRRRSDRRRWLFTADAGRGEITMSSTTKIKFVTMKRNRVLCLRPRPLTTFLPPFERQCVPLRRLSSFAKPKLFSFFSFQNSTVP